MYNRYIPQSDGSYRRSPVQDTPPPPCPAPEPECPPQPCKQTGCPRPRPRQVYHSERRAEPAGSFLKNLLPKDFDTSDLMVVLLLVLMAGDCPEDRSTALLTLALYFLM